MRSAVRETFRSSAKTVNTIRRLRSAWRRCVEGLEQFQKERSMELHAIQLDVTSERSADAAISSIFREGQRPFRVYVDPAQEGGELGGGVADRIRAEFLRRIGLEDLLTTKSHAAS